MAEKTAYTQAAVSGKYDKSSGLLGKYDNVRRFWEDQLTGIFLRPSLNDLVQRKSERMERLRILDIGCGNGDGYDLIMDVNSKDAGIFEYITAAITDDRLQTYVGLDINEELLQQAQAGYGQNPKVQFVQADLSNGLPDATLEAPPFDLYFSSYGTFSHFDTEQTVRLMADVCRHASDGALFVGDWLGRYAYEWQDLWHHPVDQEYWMNYRISYIYPEAERDRHDVATFPLRLLCADEILSMAQAAGKAAGCTLRPVKLFDRSVLIGRHMDTGDYNRHCPKMRYAVNSLFEGYTRTDLESVRVNYVPRPGFDALNHHFEMFFMAVNTLVDYTIALLAHHDPGQGVVGNVPEIQPYYPEPLKETMQAMRRVIEGVGWLQWGDVRANVIEPHLGYCLRKLEMELQQGMGTGHSLCGIFEIKK
ncbi:class I SAM-dependent methyltransferase [Desulfatitalea alkaliphila]|uniref:Class I SAM-dependent methyltransferase n=1 Tax=Desulfatitalea alkaliphila TaxID=2929485 RepID=A0AA41R4T6_9BACT|nr:class I SAM-dependent methyltransferase [Desulfatitalea alkaliphila]MCJ8501666.1 class I SAM-dependent methyltransferase [Desulfatitalea alkaliphila]